MKKVVRGVKTGEVEKNVVRGIKQVRWRRRLYEELK